MKHQTQRRLLMREQNKQLTRRVQVELWKWTKKISYSRMSIPERKALRGLMLGILKYGGVILNGIARSLDEQITVKKITERFNRHLRKESFGQALTDGLLRTVRPALRRCEFLVLDLTDISKKHARDMPGLDWVRDGSKDEMSLGYWIVNVLGAGMNGAELVPAYSELYSLKAESSSENAKILNAMKKVNETAGLNKVWLIDRGGDRGCLFHPLLDSGSKFIVRMTKKRDLVDSDGKKQNIFEIVKNTRRRHKFQILKKGERKTVTAGARRVRLTKDGPELWLVCFKHKYRKGGYFYFLTNVEKPSQKTLCAYVLHGYKLRWKIEEVHRQVKDCFDLEQLRLGNYQAIKNMNLVVWCSAAFYYTRDGMFDNPAFLLSLVPNATYRRRLREIFGFVYYKLHFAVQTLLKGVRFIPRVLFPKPSPQLTLNLKVAS